MYLSPLIDSSPERARLIGKHEAKVVWIAPNLTAPRIVSGDETGDVRIWSFSETSGQLEHTFRAPSPDAILDPTDSWMVVAPRGPHSTSEVAYVWELNGPPDAEPLVLRDGDTVWLNSAVFDDAGLWLVTANAGFGILWPLPSKRSFVLRGQSRLTSR